MVANHLLKLTGTEHRVASAYHPQTNGLTERFNQTLKGSLIQVVNEKQNDWDEKIMFSYRYEAFCICIIILNRIIYRTSIHASTGYTPFFLMHFREAKLPVHVQVESVVGGSSLPQILTEPEHPKHIDALLNLQEQYCAKATQNILCAQTRQKLHYDKKHNTNSIFKVGNKVLKSNARNRHRMGGKLEKPWLGVYIIQKDLGKGRYCLKTLEGKPLKQTIHCARLKRFLDPVVDDNIACG